MQKQNSDHVVSQHLTLRDIQPSKGTFFSQAHAKKGCPQENCKGSIQGQKYSITLHSLKAL